MQKKKKVGKTST